MGPYRATLVLAVAALLATASTAAAARPFEVELPGPAAPLTWCAAATQCPHPGNYATSSLPASMRIEARSGTFPYSTDEYMYARAPARQVTGYDDYRIDADVSSAGPLFNDSGNFGFAPFLCLAPPSGTTVVCNPAFTPALGGDVPPYTLSLVLPEDWLRYEVRVGWRFAGDAGNRNPTAGKYVLNAALRWYGIDDTPPVVSRRDNVSAHVTDAGSGVRRVDVLIDGEARGHAETAAPRTGVEPASELDVSAAGTLTPGQHSATVVAVDWAGRETSSSWSFTIPAAIPAPAPAPAPTRIVVTLDYFLSQGRLTRFNVKDVPAGATVTATCPRHCARKTVTKRDARGTVSLKRLVGGRRLKAGPTITVTVTRAGEIGAVKAWTLRRQGPRITTRCLPPGATKPARCTSP
jgi:hypothetical protein